MKRTAGAILMTIMSFSIQAQIADVESAKNAAFQAAKRMDEAMMNKQYDDYVAFIHPKVAESVQGGREALSVQTAVQVKELEEDGSFITAVWPNMPKVIVDTAGEWQCVLPQYMEYRLPEGKIKATTTLIGISPDQGKTWYFVDVADRTLPDMRKLFPNLSSKLQIPVPMEPEFTKD